MKYRNKDHSPIKIVPSCIYLAKVLLGSVFAFLHISCFFLLVCLIVYFGDTSRSLHRDQTHPSEHLLTIILWGRIINLFKWNVLVSFLVDVLLQRMLQWGIATQLPLPQGGLNPHCVLPFSLLRCQVGWFLRAFPGQRRILSCWEHNTLWKTVFYKQ